MICSKRANQISIEIKEELNRKLEEFANYTDNLEEVFENREQIEISKFYERLAETYADCRWRNLRTIRYTCARLSNQLILSMLSGKKILVGVTGSIAAYKTAMLIRLLVKGRCRSEGSDDPAMPKNLLLRLPWPHCPKIRY